MRQRIRKCMLIISLLLFPITIWYMSPYLIIQGAMEGIASGSFLVFIAMLLGSVFGGRSFCGWLCPVGGLQECLFAVNDKVPKQGGRNRIKYMIWSIWIMMVILCFIFRNKTIRIDFFYMTDHGISIADIYNYVIYYGVLILVLIPAILFGKRAFCHYFCWMAPFMVIGTKLREQLHLPGIHVQGKKESCIGCKKCNQVCPMGIDVVACVENRQQVDTECIQCGACVDHCPKKALCFGMKRGI
ncbi:MAG: 4Fe-4S binding protein [Eubacteriales bacterium]|nr:4Fe-4S binding protein [Eubacteriales bacterium]